MVCAKTSSANSIPEIPPVCVVAVARCVSQYSCHLWWIKEVSAVQEKRYVKAHVRFLVAIASLSFNIKQIKESAQPDAQRVNKRICM